MLKSEFLRRFAVATGFYLEARAESPNRNIWARAQDSLAAAGLPYGGLGPNHREASPLMKAVVDYCHSVDRVQLLVMVQTEEAWEYFQSLETTGVAKEARAG